MDAQNLLDEIFGLYQKLPQNAKISETMKANKDAIKIIEKALFEKYEQGCLDTSKKIQQMQIEKQIKNN